VTFCVITADEAADVPPVMEPVLKLELGLSQRQPASFAEA
jgi:hypothetical protein